MSLGKRLLYCTALFVFGLTYSLLEYGTENLKLIIIMSFYFSVLFFIGFTWKKHIKNGADRINEWCLDYRPWKFPLLVISIMIGAPIAAFILFVPIIIVILNL